MERRIRILLVGNDELAQAAFKRFVEREDLAYEVEMVGSGSHAGRSLAAAQFDVAIVDYGIGDGGVPDLPGDVGGPPVVALVDGTDDAALAAAMGAGAADCLVKDPEGRYLERLPLTVENAVRTAELARANERLRAKVAELSRAVGPEGESEERSKLREVERRFQTLLDNVRLIAVGLDRDGRVFYANPHLLALTGYTFDEVVSRDWFETFVPERDRPDITGVFSETLADSIEPYYENPILSRDGEERLIAWNNTLLLDSHAKPAGMMSIGEDITERRAADEALRQSRAELENSHRVLAERVMELEALHRIGVAMSSELETEALLQLIVEQAAALVDAASCSVLLLDEESGGLVFRAAVDSVVGMHIPPGQGIVGRALRERVPQVVHDVTADPNHYPVTGQETDVPTRSLLAVPLLVGDRAIGVLSAINKREGRFGERDRDLLVTMASHAAIVIENVRLYEQAQQEIAERTRAEAALRTSEERLKLALEAVNDGLWDWNLVTGEIYRSPRWQTMLGFDPGGVAGNLEAWEELVHPDDRSRVTHDWDEHRQGRTPSYATEHRIRTQYGEWIWVLDRGRVVERDEDGRPLRAVGTQTDITERVQSQQELRIRDSAIASSISAIAISDLDGNLTYVNPAFLEIWGYEDEMEILGRQAVEFWRTADRAADVVQTLRKEGGWFGELVAKRKDGTHCDIQVAASLVTDRTGLPVGMMSSFLDIAERKQAVAEISRLAAAVDQATETIMITNLDGDIVYANPCFEASSGYTVAEVLGQNPRFLKSGYQDTAFYQDLWDTITAGQTWKGTFINKRKDGSEYHEAATIFPVTDPTGQIINYAAVKRDITEQVRAEAALRESEARYRAVVEGQTELICRSLPDLTLDFVNEAYCSYYGQRREDLVGHEFLSHIAEEDRAEVEGRIRSLNREEPVVTLEHRAVTPHRQVRWQQWTNRAIFDEEGRITEYQSVGRDVTDRRLATEALERYAERLRTLRAIDGAILAAWSSEDIAQAALRHMRELVPCMGVSIWMFDSETREMVLFALQTDRESEPEPGVRFPLAEGIEVEMLRQGKVVMDQDLLTPPSQPGPNQDAGDPGQGAGRPPVVEAMRALGVRSYIAVPLIAQGELTGTLALGAESPGGFAPEYVDIAREIADQLAVALRQARLHEQVGRYVTELERRVAERTADLSAANAELARAARLKDEFLASMSHELRTPLNAILGLSEALQEQVYGPLSARQFKSLRNIEASGRHLLTLINDILDVSKIGAGKLELEKTLVSVESVSRASLGLIKQPAHRKRLKISSSLDSAVRTIHADPRRLKQILVNLLSNAVKFTPEGGQIGLEVVGDAEGQAVHFAVWDTGVGIAPEGMERLFRPFVQLDSSLSRQHTGTGLGLVLVHRMAELHGGGVSVESEPGKGSRFTVSLPWQGPEVSDAEATTTDGEAETREKATLQCSTPRRALIVENSPAAAEHASRYLDEIGVEAVVHPQGEGAFERTLELLPDIVILDLLLPDLPGWEVMIQMKEDARTREIPVLIVSVVDDRARGLALGAAGHLVKPISRRRFHEAVEHVLSQGAEMQDAETIPSQQAMAPGVKASCAEQRLILLAEDNEDNINTISDYLLTRGYWVVVARNGAEAVERAMEERPDAILMDVQMPAMDGLEATRRIRADADLKAVPIIALTALAMPGDRERCLDAGADVYLSKPVSLKMLVETIESRLGQGPA